jgi:hypothetical protein
MIDMSETKSAHGMRLATPYAFIDTEAFRAAGLDWKSRTWKSLIDLAGNGTLHPVITPVTTREVEARLTEALLEAEAAAKKHASVFGQFYKDCTAASASSSKRQNSPSYQSRPT